MKDLANKSFKEETVAQICWRGWILIWKNVARETQKILEEEIDTHIKEEILVNLPNFLEKELSEIEAIVIE